MSSILSHLVRWGFLLKGVKKSYETSRPDYRRMRRWNFTASDVRRVYRDRFAVTEVFGGRIYEYSGRNLQSDEKIVWFPGGAFSLGPFRAHFSRLATLCERTGRPGILLDYPKVPEVTHREILAFLRGAIERCLAPARKSIWIGDSAGGGLALAFAIDQAKKGGVVPRKLFGLSPFVDLTLSQEEVASVDPIDPFLAPEGVRAFGAWYAGESDPRDPTLSPLFAEASELPFSIDLYSGSRDILHPSIVAFAKKSRAGGDSVRLHAYEGMMHAWPLMPMPEAKQVMADIALKIREERP